MRVFYGVTMRLLLLASGRPQHRWQYPMRGGAMAVKPTVSKTRGDNLRRIYYYLRTSVRFAMVGNRSEQGRGSTVPDLHLKSRQRYTRAGNRYNYPVPAILQYVITPCRPDNGLRHSYQNIRRYNLSMTNTPTGCAYGLLSNMLFQ